MGNAAYEKAWESRLRAVGVSAERVESASVRPDPDGRTIYDIRFKLDADEGTSVLVIVKCEGASGLEVGFVGASSFTEALLAVGRKLGKGALKWREDKPFGEA